jgi:hypothetical protein
MKTFLIILGILLVLLLVFVLLVLLLTPWMDRWGSTPEERSSTLPGDDLVANPAKVINHAVTVKAAPEKIYPWLLQIGADKAGMYSYTALERLVGCKMAKDEVIRTEWQTLKAGDQMKMCAGEFAPPPYIVARILPNQSVIFGHKEGDKWMESWQFVLVPQADGTTRLLTRTRTNMVGGAWEIFNRVAFVMERKMLLTIRNLAEGK